MKLPYEWWLVYSNILSTSVVSKSASVHNDVALWQEILYFMPCTTVVNLPIDEYETSELYSIHPNHNQLCLQTRFVAMAFKTTDCMLEWLSLWPSNYTGRRTFLTMIRLMTAGFIYGWVGDALLLLLWFEPPSSLSETSASTSATSLMEPSVPLLCNTDSVFSVLSWSIEWIS